VRVRRKCDDAHNFLLGKRGGGWAGTEEEGLMRHVAAALHHGCLGQAWSKDGTR
jgi:hypothetical protein